MKRARFQETVLDGCHSLRQWFALVWRKRGEAPYELQRVWRRIFGVPASVPYADARFVPAEGAGETPDDAFYVEVTQEGEPCVLVFGRAEPTGLVVHFYDSEGVAFLYDGWRDKSAWPWPERAYSVEAVPTDVWTHLGRMLFECREFYTLYCLADAQWERIWRQQHFQTMWTHMDSCVPMQLRQHDSPLLQLANFARAMSEHAYHPMIVALEMIYQHHFPGQVDQLLRGDSRSYGYPTQSIYLIGPAGFVIKAPREPPRHLRTPNEIFNSFIK
jgi:hypothetical protein